MLTREQAERTWEVIHAQEQGDDREPRDVIREDFLDDEARYLETMARYHGVDVKTEH